MPLQLDRIGDMTQGDLRRFIINLLLSDPGALPRQPVTSTVPASASPLTTKGDIYTRDASGDARLAIAADGWVLTADAASATGNKWALPAAGGSTPTGTGFRHVTGGVEDGASKLVDTADINADQVTYGKIQNVVANNTVHGRVSGAGGDIEELTAAQVRTLIGVATTPTGTGFTHETAGAQDAAAKLVDTADINNDQVTYGKIQNVVTNNRILGRVSGAGGDIEELTGVQVGALLQVPIGTGFRHVTAGAEDAAAKLVDTADINASQVTYSKIQNVVANNVLIGNMAGAGNPFQELTFGNVGAALPLFGTLGQGSVPASGGGTTNFLRADGTWTSPVATGAWDPGSQTITTERFLLQYRFLNLTGSEDLKIQGTTDVVLAEFGEYTENVIGAPRAMLIAYVVPDGYFYDVLGNLPLVGLGSLSVRGTGEVLLTDDMAQRNNLILAGRV